MMNSNKSNNRLAIGLLVFLFLVGGFIYMASREHGSNHEPRTMIEKCDEDQDCVQCRHDCSEFRYERDMKRIKADMEYLEKWSSR